MKSGVAPETSCGSGIMDSYVPDAVGVTVASGGMTAPPPALGHLATPGTPLNLRSTCECPESTTSTGGDGVSRGKFGAVAVHEERQSPRVTMSTPRVTLSTTSVYPESTVQGIACAADLGFDGIELMVGIDGISADIDRVEEAARANDITVTSVHAPCLLVTPTVWGGQPWPRLEKACEAARRFGARTVVVHPPFRWQRDYAAGFEEGVARLEADPRNVAAGVRIAVENMYPWRTPVGRFLAYAPDWDPSERSYSHLTLDLSHAATAQCSALDLVQRWGERLTHIHLTDGSGSFRDEHLMPGQGGQHAWQVVREAVQGGFRGDVVLEVNTRRLSGPRERRVALSRSLVETRQAIADALACTTRTDGD